MQKDPESSMKKYSQSYLIDETIKQLGVDRFVVFLAVQSSYN
jgi:hypothetical protein